MSSQDATLKPVDVDCIAMSLMSSICSSSFMTSSLLLKSIDLSISDGFRRSKKLSSFPAAVATIGYDNASPNLAR